MARRTPPFIGQQDPGSVQAPAVAYVRVSTEEQAQFGASLDAQEQRIRAYCTAQGLDLTKLFREEGVSASKPLADRPLGGQLVADVASQGIRHVVAVKLDRLFRSAADAMSQADAWDRRGVSLHLIDMGGQALNTGGAMGRMMLTMMAAFAEFERNLIRERTAAALQHKKGQRQVYGPVPLGFVALDGQLVADAGETALVAEIRAWRAAGRTLRAIAAELNARGAKTKRGGRAWHASTVAKILANRIHS